MKAAAAKVEGFTPYQKFVVAVLSFLQFTIILDFMIMSPLGAVLMPALNITPSQFGFVVSAYAFSAGIAGFLAAGFADRFDRKRLLLFFYTGFILGTLFCGLAPSYPILLAARIITGLFGGVIGSIVFAITTDLFPVEKRGRVMGLLQTAFAASQVLGLPVGLYFSNHWGWHAPFLMIVGLGALVGIVIFQRLKPIDEHLKAQAAREAQGHIRTSAVSHLWKTIALPRYQFAFAATALLSTGGFMLMPFGSAFTVNNLGIPLDQLPIIYLVTGLCSIVMGPLIGRLADSFGYFRTFFFGTLVTIVMVSIYTHLGRTPLPWVILVNALMFVGIFSRMIPSQALVSTIPDPASRGAFMSVSSSVQQISGGFASVLAGLIVSFDAGGALQHFELVGYTVTLTAIICLGMIYRIHRNSVATQRLAQAA